MPPARAMDSLRRLRSAAHRSVFSATNGRVLATWGGLPVVLLTTTGRKTGLPRTTIVTSPLQDGDRVVLVASNGGSPRHPAWFLNLRDRPEVTVLMGGRRTGRRARVATPAEKDRLWAQVASRAPSYARYQRQTTRDIPIVLLEPADQ